MKMETRSMGSLPRPSSTGGATREIRETRPSAGEITSPSRTGVTRAGSRKKKMTQTVSASMGQVSHAPHHRRIRVAAPAIAMKG